MKILVTGSTGLIGSEAVQYFAAKHHEVYGIDNNMRMQFFGQEGDTSKIRSRLVNSYSNYRHYDIDIRNRLEIISIIQSFVPDVIIHTAAQPSHDYAASIPFEDFEINALGTLNLIEGLRRHNESGIFIYMSTNKVYGDLPNLIPLVEQEMRWDFSDKRYFNGISEDFGIDQTKHSLFGASKLAGDVLVQEYGQYFGMKTCILRGGCLTGSMHSGVELHGFLNYLVKCNVQRTKYTIFGYKGKQVRDNIHSSDVVRFMDCFIEKPRVAEVYNIGGGRQNSCSILELFKLVEEVTGKPMIFEYTPQYRKGDHICYISNLDKMKSHYPEWGIQLNLKQLVQEIVEKYDVEEQ